MPLLSRDEVERMFAGGTTLCQGCKMHVWKNYCRQCDEFCTDGHGDDCALAEHVGHKGYDSNAPTIGDAHAGHRYEAENGAYRLNTNERYQ